MNKGLRQSVVLSNVPEIFYFFFEEWWSGKYCCGVFFSISICLFNSIAKFCEAPFPRNLKHSCMVFWHIGVNISKTTHIWVLSLLSYAKSPRDNFTAKVIICEDQAPGLVSEDFPKCLFPLHFILSLQLIFVLLGWSISSFGIHRGVWHANRHTAITSKY